MVCSLNILTLWSSVGGWISTVNSGLLSSFPDVIFNVIKKEAHGKCKFYEFLNR